MWCADPRLSPRVRRASRRQTLRGFSLMEVSLAMVVMAGLTTAWLMLWSTETFKAQSRVAGQQYRTLDAAVRDYMALHHGALLGLPDECSLVTLAHTQSLASPPALVQGRCGLQLNAVKGLTGSGPVANGLQPSVAELQALGLLDSSFRNVLLMRTEAVVARPQNHAPSRELAEPGFAARIQRVCASTPCTSYQLSSLVFNTQPYSLQRLRSMASSLELLQDALLAAGPDAALASPAAFGGNGELQGWGASFSVANPIRLPAAGGSAAGLAGILGVRSGHGSAAQAEFARTDGSRPMTGTWSLGGQDVRDVKTLMAQTVYAQILDVADVTSTQILSVKGDASANTLYVRTKATVRELSMLSNGKLRLPLASVGQACASGTQSLAMSRDGTRILVCNVLLGQWQANQ